MGYFKFEQKAKLKSARYSLSNSTVIQRHKIKSCKNSDNALLIGNSKFYGNQTYWKIWIGFPTFPNFKMRNKYFNFH